MPAHERSAVDLRRRVGQAGANEGETSGTMTAAGFDNQYYRRIGIDADRIALWWYARVIGRLRAEGGRLLDFGCGTGHLLKRLSERFEAYGYDLSPAARSSC